MDDNKVNEMQKEIERLTKRNKVLTKRCKKLEEANKQLIEELEIYEATDIHLPPDEDICPTCGGDLIIMTKPDDSVLKRCNNFPFCKYKG